MIAPYPSDFVKFAQSLNWADVEDLTNDEDLLLIRERLFSRDRQARVLAAIDGVIYLCGADAPMEQIENVLLWLKPANGPVLDTAVLVRSVALAALYSRTMLDLPVDARVDFAVFAITAALDVEVDPLPFHELLGMLAGSAEANGLVKLAEIIRAHPSYAAPDDDDDDDDVGLGGHDVIIETPPKVKTKAKAKAKTKAKKKTPVEASAPGAFVQEARRLIHRVAVDALDGLIR